MEGAGAPVLFILWLVVGPRVSGMGGVPGGGEVPQVLGRLREARREHREQGEDEKARRQRPHDAR